MIQWEFLPHSALVRILKCIFDAGGTRMLLEVILVCSEWFHCFISSQYQILGEIKLWSYVKVNLHDRCSKKQENTIGRVLECQPIYNFALNHCCFSSRIVSKLDRRFLDDRTVDKLRIVLLGARKVGKTSILDQYLSRGNANLTEHDSGMISFSSGSIDIIHNSIRKGKEDKISNLGLIIVDTDDPFVRYRADFSWDLYFNAHCFIMVFDSTRLETIDTLKYWIEDILQRAKHKPGALSKSWGGGSPALPNGSIIIVASKIDLYQGEKSTLDEIVKNLIAEFHEYPGQFYFITTSALEYENIAMTFDLSIIEAARLTVLGSIHADKRNAISDFASGCFLS